MRFKFDLKPFQRVKLENGNLGIILPLDATHQGHSSVHTGQTIFIATKTGWLNAGYGNASEYRIVMVWDKPKLHSEALNFDACGDLLYDESNVSQRLEDLRRRKEAIEREMEQLEGGLGT